MINTPKDLESYIQYVHSSLLNLQDEGVIVSRATTLRGNSTSHEFDVYYQFERAGIAHKVAIECKFTRRPVEKADVMEFHAKIQEVGNPQGVMVSKSGYQKGAIEYGNFHHIKLLKLEDIPTLNILVGDRVKSIALPSAEYIGAPFWVLMEKEGNSVSGAYHKLANKHKNRIVIPLFFSKRAAVNYLEQNPHLDTFVIRGLPQHCLDFIIKLGEMSKLLFLPVITSSKEEGISGLISTPEQLKKEFLLSEITIEEYAEERVKSCKIKNEISFSMIYKELMDSKCLNLLKRKNKK